MKKIIIGAVIITALTLMIVLNLVIKNNSKDGLFSGKAIEVEAVQAKSGELIATILINGTVEEKNKKTVYAVGTVKVTDVNVKVGDQIEAGDVLYAVDVESMVKEMDKLIVDKEIQELQSKKIESMNQETGTYGAAIALELAKINLSTAQRNYENQKEVLEKNAYLYNEGIISKNEYESFETALEEAESQLETAELNLGKSQADLNQIYADNKVNGTSLELDAEIQLKNLQNLQLNIDRIRDQIKNQEEACKAQMTGVITMADVEIGETVSTNQKLFEITDMDQLIVSASVREYDVTQLELGQTVRFFGDAIVKEDIVTGIVDYMAPVAGTIEVNGRQTTGVEIKMSIKEGMDYLKPGYKLECEIETKRVENAVIGDFNMLLEDKDNNPYVFVVNEGKIEKRNVVTGISSDFETEILEGFSEGEWVVINPSVALDDGMKVKIIDNQEEGN